MAHIGRLLDGQAVYIESLGIVVAVPKGAFRILDDLSLLDHGVLAPPSDLSEPGFASLGEGISWSCCDCFADGSTQMPGARCDQLVDDPVFGGADCRIDLCDLPLDILESLV